MHVAKHFLVVLLMGVVCVACGPGYFRPGPGVQTVAGAPHAAKGESNGVRMVVRTDAWSSFPKNLEQEVTPIKVTIQNTSNRSVRVCYEDFALEGYGVRYAALPPLEINESVVERPSHPVYYPPAFVLTPRFLHRGFWIAPWHAPYYSAFRPWPDPWLYNRGYYDLYFPRWRVALPSKQMLELAIPEGVVEPGGSVTGFLYFSEIPRAVDRVTFVAKLVDGHTEETFGTIEIPLVR
jgi:hypothetical protein